MYLYNATIVIFMIENGEQVQSSGSFKSTKIFLRLLRHDLIFEFQLNNRSNKYQKHHSKVDTNLNN